MSARGRTSWLLDWTLLFVFAAVLIWPLFKVKYLDLWSSIESTFISDARFLADNWPHPGWQPNWYTGTRTDYVYPPALRYGTAVLAKYYPRMLPVRAYHIYVAFFYCFGIAGVYLLARQGSGSRVAGGLAAVAAALVSPAYLVMQNIREDTPYLMPYRLNVLIRYGEGPHMSALAWIPVALFFSWRALEKWRPGSFVAASLACAMVVSNNFYGATSLAMLFPVLVWSLYITHVELAIWLRAAGIAVLAYGLTAFWLVPSYIEITRRNMQFVSAEGNLWSRWVALGFIVVFLLLSDKFSRGRPHRAWFTFLAGALGFFIVNTLGNHFLDFRIVGEPSRLVPELDMLAILFGVELLRRLWSYEGRWKALRIGAAAVLAFAMLAPSWNYIRHAHDIFVPYPNYQDRVEYELQDWMAKNMPGSRALAAGSVRFWYNAWHDLPQLGGGSEQGVLNPLAVVAQWQILQGPEADVSTMWMQILGLDAVIVNDRTSRDQYKDYAYPEKFRGVLPVLYDNSKGDAIYSVPRRFQSRARVVDRARFDALPWITGNGELPQLKAWHAVVEEGAISEAPMQREGTDSFRVKATVGEGQSVWIQESFDHNWRAYSNGQLLPMRRDKVGFMVIDAPPGTHDIRVEFPVPKENIAGRILTALSAVFAVSLLWFQRRK